MIVIGGENLIDMVQRSDQGQWPGYEAIPGGAPYNVALACARQGRSVGYATPISRDTLGQNLADRVLADGVILLAGRNDAPSSMAVVSLTNGQASYAFYRSETAERHVTVDSIRQNMPAEAKILMVGGLAIVEGTDADAWHKTFADFHGVGKITAMDPNIRVLMIKDRAAYMARFEAMLSATDMLKLSDEDLEWLYPDIGLEAAFALLQTKTSARMIVVTRGSDGAIGVLNGARAEVPAGVADPFMDTVGAGDTFMATLVAEIDRRVETRDDLGKLNGDDLADMMQRAALAAAINCSRSGCNPPYAKELP